MFWFIFIFIKCRFWAESYLCFCKSDSIISGSFWNEFWNGLIYEEVIRFLPLRPKLLRCGLSYIPLYGLWGWFATELYIYEKFRSRMFVFDLDFGRGGICGTAPLLYFGWSVITSFRVFSFILLAVRFTGKLLLISSNSWSTKP